MACSGQALGQGPETPPTFTPPAPKVLGMGDAAPAMTIGKWLRGDEVKSFEKDKVYVLEFWATWCGPCIGAMPHLTKLQAKYAERGLRIVGVSAEDQRGNTLQAVEQFLSKRGKQAAYAFAWDKGSATWDAYMTAARQGSIPCSFVIGKDGKIAYVGHPSLLDEIIPKVLDGTWKGQQDLDRLMQVEQQLRTIVQKSSADMPAALAELEKFLEQHPGKKAKLADRLLMMRMQARDLDKAKATAEEMVKRAVEEKDSEGLEAVAALWQSPMLNPEKKELGVALDAAKRAVEITQEKAVSPMLTLGDVHFAMGEKEKAREWGEKALRAAGDDEQMKRFAEFKLEAFKK